MNQAARIGAPHGKEYAARIYFCGGAALNIGSGLFRGGSMIGGNEGLAKMELAFVDTSRSNTSDSIKDSFYCVEGTMDDEIDGSGKVRRTNYEAIKRAAPDILHQYRPGDLNVVIHSASGGKVA